MKNENIEMSIQAMLDRERDSRNAELQRQVAKQRTFEEILLDLRALQAEYGRELA